MQHLSSCAKRIRASALREILKITEQPGYTSLAGGLPSPHLFPVARIREALDHLMRTEPTGCLQYGPSEGVRELREWVAAKHATPQNELTADNVLITTGSQQALDLIGKVLIEPGSKVLLENPTYLGAIQALNFYQPVFEELPNRDGHIDPIELNQLVNGATLAYVIPNYQNPTGRLMSLADRHALAKHAKQHKLRLIEDNPYGEVQFEPNGLPTIRSLCPEQTIYLGSFSKTLAPGLRVGYAIADHATIKTLTLLKQSADLHTASLNQRLVLSLVHGLDDQIVRVRQHYAMQCQTMIDAMRRHMPRQVRYAAPRGGMFIWCELPTHINTSHLLNEALQHKIAFVPGEHFYFKDPQTHTLRLSFATATAEQIEHGIHVLGELIADRIATSSWNQPTQQHFQRVVSQQENS